MPYKPQGIASQREQLAASFRELFPSPAEQRAAYRELEALIGVSPARVYETLSGIGSGYSTGDDWDALSRALRYRRATGSWPASRSRAGGRL